MCIRTNSVGNITWEKTYQGDKTAYGSQIELTDDGFIIVGASSSSGYREAKFYLLRIDKNGEKLWEKKYSEEFRGEAKNICQTSDGNFIITGWIFIQDYNVYLLKVDIKGNCIWFKIFNCDENFGSCGWSVKESSDGGYVIIGDKGEKSCIIKTDSLGDTLWMEAIGRNDSKIRCLSIEQTTDGGYIVSGAINTYMEELKGWIGWNIYITKTDSIGKIKWVESLRDQGNGYGQEIRQTNDNGYILTGMLDGDMCLIKLKSEK